MSDFQGESQLLGRQKGKTWFKITHQPWSSPGTATSGEGGVRARLTNFLLCCPFESNVQTVNLPPLVWKCLWCLVAMSVTLWLGQGAGESLRLQRKQGRVSFWTRLHLFWSLLPIIASKSPPQASIWLLMRTCHTHFQSCYSFSLDCSRRPFLLLKIVILSESTSASKDGSVRVWTPSTRQSQRLFCLNHIESDGQCNVSAL